MTLSEQVINDIEYAGAELQLNIWRGGVFETLQLIWDEDRYIIK